MHDAIARATIESWLEAVSHIPLLDAVFHTPLQTRVVLSFGVLFKDLDHIHRISLRYGLLNYKIIFDFTNCDAFFINWGVPPLAWLRTGGGHRNYIPTYTVEAAWGFRPQEWLARHMMAAILDWNLDECDFEREAGAWMRHRGLRRENSRRVMDWS